MNSGRDMVYKEEVLSGSRLGADFATDSVFGWRLCSRIETDLAFGPTFPLK